MTTVWRDSDIPTMLLICGAVPVTIDGTNGIAIMDWNDELMTQDQARGSVIVGVPMLTIQTSQFPFVHVDSVAVIDGVTYTVRERLKYGDAGTTKLYLGDSTGAPPVHVIIDGGEFDGSDGTGMSPDGGGFFLGAVL